MEYFMSSSGFPASLKKLKALKKVKSFDNTGDAGPTFPEDTK